jgi:pyrimidine operon attenuation protein/uracil phosphoribosyltransferase
MSDAVQRLRDAGGLEDLVRSLAEAIADGRRLELPLCVVGIRSRGYPLAQRIATHLETRLGGPVPVGAVDITLYRDDLDRADRWPVLRGTEIPFSVDNTEVVLVDDVLHTGRTVRAALDAVCDLGRPGCVRLAVLVDRGGRELPIQADFVGMATLARDRERVLVRVRPLDEVDEIVWVEEPRTS